MSLTLSTILAAAEQAAKEEHKSEAPFFIAGAVLVAFAIALSIFGFKRPEFPGGGGAARGIMALSVVLVAATLFSAIYVSA